MCPNISKYREPLNTVSIIRATIFTGIYLIYTSYATLSSGIPWNIPLATCIFLVFTRAFSTPSILYNYPLKGRRIVGDIYRDAKLRGIYPPLFTDPEGDSCFSIYQIRWKKNVGRNFFFWNFREKTGHFSLRSQNSEYPRIFQVTGVNQNVRKLLLFGKY